MRLALMGAEKEKILFIVYKAAAQPGKFHRLFGLLKRGQGGEYPVHIQGAVTPFTVGIKFI